MSREQPDSGLGSRVRSIIDQRRAEHGLVGTNDTFDQLSGRTSPIASFDVFDTLLIRLGTTEATVHRLVARAHAADLLRDPDFYVAARQQAGKLATDADPAGAPSIDAIHQRLDKLLGVDVELGRRLLDSEIEIETRLLRKAPGADRLVEQARSRGARIAFTTDMHLPAAVLRRVLEREGLYEPDDLLVVSCEEGATKARQGELFTRLAEHASRPIEAIVHTGNDPWADYAMARSRGAAAVLRRNAEANRYEAALAADPDPTVLAPLLAGHGRQQRVAAEARGVEPAAAQVICGVSAPTMVGFGLWLARLAHDRGFDRLYFLARNGRLPYEVFRRLPDTLTGSTTGHYLRLSRDVVRLPSAAAVDLDRWLELGQREPDGFLVQRRRDLTAGQLFRLVGFDVETDLEVFDQLGLDPTTRLGRHELGAWRRALDDPRVRALIAERAEPSRNRLVEYLDDQGVLEPGRIAMVDIGWTGQQSAMISAAANSRPGHEIEHLHLGQKRRIPLIGPATIHSYLFEPGDQPVANPVGLYELFSATGEPGMAGLRRDPAGTIVAVDRETDDPVRRSAHIEPLHRLTLDIVEALGPHLGTEHLEAELRPALR